MLKTDRQLHQDVLNELAFEPRVDHRDVMIAVCHGIVTLQGKIPSLGQKWAAEEAVKRVSGVRGIAQELQIGAVPHIPSDPEIAAAIGNIMLWDSFMPDTVRIFVQDGRVTLSGEAAWKFQVEDALRAIARVRGVRDVHNELLLHPHGAAKDVRGQILRQFGRSANSDTKEIEVLSDGGRVMLRGRARSWSEREEAERTAWSVQGVITVENEILVVA